jgi:hypothetical protein
MNRLLLMLCGSAVGLGILVMRVGARGQDLGLSRGPRSLSQPTLRRIGLSLSSGLVVFLLTGWFIASFGLAVLTFLVLSGATRGASGRRDERVAEAVALWSEQLRDTLSASHGLQQTIVATAPHAPVLLRPAVAQLAASLPYGSVSVSLRRFAHDVNHSSADFVAAALIAATEYEARDVGSLLGHLARCSRDEALMHQRVWVGRARTRTAVKIIMATVVGFVAALMLLNREYLEPYSTPSGQLILTGIFAVFAIALVMLQRGSRVILPDRFIAQAAV